MPSADEAAAADQGRLQGAESFVIVNGSDLRQGQDETLPHDFK
jgi:hypothetical protein